MQDAENAERGLVKGQKGKVVNRRGTSDSKSAVQVALCPSPLGRHLHSAIPHTDANGVHHESLSRGLDNRSVAAAVDKDADFQRERAAREIYIGAAHRDARTATERLEEQIARDGAATAARRITADVHLLGELRGREGLFASAKAREETGGRLLSVTVAIGPNVVRTAEFENRTA